MKTIITLIMVGLAVVAFAQVEPPKHDWKATLKVVDETGQPVPAAKVHVYYGTNEIAGLSDTNGIFAATHYDAVEGLGFYVEKLGYYSFRASYPMGRRYKVEIWNPRQTIILKRIIQPIPMYARNARIEIPRTDTPIGFDLVEADWVAPYGKGKHPDFIFSVQRRWVNRNDFDGTMTVTFPNRGDGVLPISVSLNQGSELRMAGSAPLTGYLPEISKSLSNTPGNGWKDNEREGNKEQNYYFRIRTVLGEAGNIKSALYGKIYDDFAIDPINSKTEKIFFNYYLNPTPNDRNVEFNPKMNLMKNLKLLENVKEP